MSVLFVILPAILLIVLAAVLAYLWAARNGQFDDLTTPAVRSLQDDGEPQAASPAAAHAPSRPEGAPEGKRPTG